MVYTKSSNNVRDNRQQIKYKKEGQIVTINSFHGKFKVYSYTFNLQDCLNHNIGFNSDFNIMNFLKEQLLKVNTEKVVYWDVEDPLHNRILDTQFYLLKDLLLILKDDKLKSIFD